MHYTDFKISTCPACKITTQAGTHLDLKIGVLPSLSLFKWGLKLVSGNTQLGHPSNLFFNRMAVW